MTVDLHFKGAWTPASGSTTDLSFGAQEDSAPDAVSAALRIVLSRPTVRIRALYNNLVSRKLEGGGKVGWQRASCQTNRAQDGWGQMTQLSGHQRGAPGLAWDRGRPSATSLALTSGDNIPARHASGLGWDKAQRSAATTTGRFHLLRAQHDMAALPWRQADAFSHCLGSPFVWLVPLHHQHRSLSQAGKALSQRWHSGFARGIGQSARWHVAWNRGRLPHLGESHLPVSPPVSVPQPKRNPTLDFICRATRTGLAWRPALLLDFGKHPCPGSDNAGVVNVPVLKVYVVNNVVELARLPGREAIPVKSIQIGIDASAWAWGFSASLPYAALHMIEPTSSGPVEIEITINGAMWVMLVESFEVHRQFGQASLNIKGRSLAAYLAEPYAPRRSFVPDAPFTAQQLAAQELTRPGLVTGFNLDWRLPDWLVPEGSWRVQALTPMAVISRIVESAGGTLNAHTRLKTLVATSRYPALPWNWANVPPDISLPVDAVKTLNLRWQEKPTFNAVYVSGERQGITGHVVRSGTAGDAIAPMVVDGLITHADAARERGRAILADTGKQAMVTLELPMFNAPGLIEPGLLIAVGEGTNHWRGLVRSTSISAAWSESLTVRQSVEVERHYW